MAKKSKQLRAALEKIDSTKAYSVEEAVALAKETNFAKFDATVEVAYNLNIDVKKAAGVEKGSGTPNKTKVATVTRAQVQQIAETKMPDLNAANVESAMRMIEGTARSMGFTVVD